MAYDRNGKTSQILSHIMNIINEFLMRQLVVDADQDLCKS